jgi:2'-5' RNA ligase
MVDTVHPGSLQLVHFVEQQLEGWTINRDHWPLHITLVPWFTVDDEEAVMRSLQRVADQTSPMALAVGEQEDFGVNNEVPVNVIKNQKHILDLHETLVETLGEADTAYHEQEYMGSRYVAHITRHEVDGRHSNKGEEIIMRDFHLVRLVDAKTCLIEKQFNLAHVR